MGPAHLRCRLNGRRTPSWSESLACLGQFECLCVVTVGQHTPCLGFVAPGPDFVVPSVFGEARGRSEACPCRVRLVQIDVNGGPEQRQPAPDDEQPLMFGQGLAAVEQAIHIAEVLADAAEQHVRRGLGIRDRQFVHDGLKARERLLAHVAHVHAAHQFERFEFVVFEGDSGVPGLDERRLGDRDLGRVQQVSQRGGIDAQQPCELRLLVGLRVVATGFPADDGRPINVHGFGERFLRVASGLARLCQLGTAYRHRVTSPPGTVHSSKAVRPAQG